VQRYFLEMAYLGTRYVGWQSQPNGISIQIEVEKALSTVIREDISVTGAGRTDAGVHASFYVAHFDSVRTDLHGDSKLINSLNELLPNDIAIMNIHPVKPDAHARFSAISRTYRYTISRCKDPFSIGTSYLYRGNLDVEKMQIAADKLTEYRDFKCFSKTGSDVKTFICTLYFAKWETIGSKLVFTIKADRFLRNMVRAIVGTLLDVCRERITPEEFAGIIEARNRSLAGTSAPPEGLLLIAIEYPGDIYLE